MSGEITEKDEVLEIKVSKAVKDNVDAIMADKAEMMQPKGIIPFIIVLILRAFKCEAKWKCIDPVIDGSDDGVLTNPKCLEWTLKIVCNKK